jgi:hypothetical protein
MAYTPVYTFQGISHGESWSAPCSKVSRSSEKKQMSYQVTVSAIHFALLSPSYVYLGVLQHKQG